MPKLASRPLTLAIALVLPLTACEFGAPSDGGPDAPIEPTEEAAPPPFEVGGPAMLQLDVGEELLDADSSRDDDDTWQYANFAVGVVHVGLMRVGAALIVGPPAAVLSDTVNNGTITQLAWNHWVYDKDTVVGELVVSASLDVVATWTGYDMTMEIDALGPEVEINDLIWFEGTTNYFLTVGEWTMYDLDGALAAQYDYSWSADLVEATIDAPAIGVLDAVAAGSDRALVFENIDGEVAAVAWDADTFTGSVVSPQYNEGAEACWDADQLNEDCE